MSWFWVVVGFFFYELDCRVGYGDFDMGKVMKILMEVGKRKGKRRLLQL